MQKLQGKVAIVTGAASGIGAETARVLAGHGARVAVVDLNEAGAQTVADQIRSAGGEAIAVQADVSDEDQVRAAVARTLDALGRIDILHNNAALVAEGEKDRDLLSQDVRNWDRTFAVNVRGPMLFSKHTVPIMIGQGGGSIIHSSSGMGVQGEITRTAYQASKAALISLSNAIAAQYGKQRIRSNALVIGLVMSDTGALMAQALKDVLLASHLTPYLGEPRHIADVVAFLASDEAAFVTGHAMAVDGGFTSHSPTYSAFMAMFAKTGDNAL